MSNPTIDRTKAIVGYSIGLAHFSLWVVAMLWTINWLNTYNPYLLSNVLPVIVIAFVVGSFLSMYYIGCAVGWVRRKLRSVIETIVAKEE